MDFSGMVPPNPNVLCDVLRGFIAASGFNSTTIGEEFEGARMSIEVSFMPSFPIDDKMPNLPKFGDTMTQIFEVTKSLERFTYLGLEDYISQSFEQHFGALLYRPTKQFMKTYLMLADNPSDIPYIYSCPCLMDTKSLCKNRTNDFLSVDSCTSPMHDKATVNAYLKKLE